MSETILNIKLVSDRSYYVSEAIKTLRTNILFSGADIRCISITSCEPNEGKSLISLELAASLAEVDKKVLFIDGDMRKSVIKNRYKAPSVPGLSQYLTAQASEEEIICHTQFPLLDMIMCGFFPPSPVELLSGNRYTDLIASLRQKYDYIIIDTPPLGAVIDAVVASRPCDGAIIVVAQDRVSYHFAQRVCEQFIKANCKILGVILNFYKTNSKRYQYKYSQEYHSVPTKQKSVKKNNATAIQDQVK